MNAVHSDPQIVEMAHELPMRKDLARMPLSEDPNIARDQLLMRQSVPLNLHEILVKKIKDLFNSVFHK